MKKYLVLILSLTYAVLGSWQPLHAQQRITDKVKQEYAKLPNTAISSLLHATDEDEKTFFLYNENVGLFIGYGGYWDVQAVLSDKAVPFTIKAVADKEDTYQLTSNRGGNLGFNNGNYSGRLDIQRFFVDMTEDYASGTNTQMKLTSATVDGKSGYTITVVPSGCTKYDDQHDYTWMNNQTYYLYPGVKEDNVVVPEQLSWLNLSEIDANFVWKILTLKQLKSLFLNADASEADPAYANFYVKDADFGRKSQNIRYWIFGYDNAANPELFNNYTINDNPTNIASKYSKSNNVYDHYWVTNGYQSEMGDIAGEKVSADEAGKTIEGVEVSEGAYWHHYFGGYIACHLLGNNCQIRQTIHDLPGGWYEVMANGFSATTTDGNAQLFAVGSSKDATTAISQKYKDEEHLTALGYQVLKDFPTVFNSQYRVADFDKLSSMSESFVQAAKEANNGNHGKLVRVYVPEGGMLTIGARTYGLADTDWSTVDQFQVRYLGEISQELLLDEYTDHVDYLNDQYNNPQKVEGKKWNLHLRRTFNVGKWNSLVLPVSMTAAAVKAAFGNDAKLSSLETGAVDADKDSYQNTIYFTSVNLNDNDATAIQEGKLYIIKPTNKMPTKAENGLETKEWTGTSYKVSMDDYYTIPGVEFNKKGITYKKELITESAIDGTKLDGGTISFTGLYYNSDKENVMTGENYSLNAKNGRWAYISKKSYPSKGFRGWLHLNKVSAEAAKTIKFNINGVEEYNADGTTTGIDGLDINECFPQIAQRIYNLNGQLVGTSTANLPAGIYIVSGKKIIVK